MTRLLLLLMITMSSCSSIQKNQVSLTSLKLQTSYQVEWIGERPLMDYSYLNIILDQDNKAYGLAGCNYWSTNYQLHGNKLTFDSPINVTKKVCTPALMEQEQRFLDTLKTIKSWNFSDIQQLQLWPENGQPIKLWAEEKK
ncbi:META domain-containing protein [Entomomonas asaccharolytica]|uniref:META domain-containing protein n=1 Tax=Entomomonas asaccharolytica TaxID=2785331 RepID=A0A974NF48_9GAMM|nr:META domain-containing protein [Entomomonas asaccharolytica]QQP85456.1 META domain-containing protein [Entomomonas asaccharolytica]